MKNLNKVRKRHVAWMVLLNAVMDDEMKDYFFKLFSKVHGNRKRSKNISMQRCAYNTLRHFYSTTTIFELLEQIAYALAIRKPNDMEFSDKIMEMPL